MNEKKTQNTLNLMAGGLIKALNDNPKLKEVYDSIVEKDGQAPKKSSREYEKGFEHGLKYALIVVNMYAQEGKECKS